MHAETMTRRELRAIRAIRDKANRNALFAKFAKSITVFGLALTCTFGGPAASAMAATGDGGTLAPALTADQMTAATKALAATAPYETITSASETADGLNFVADVSDLNTALTVNTVSDNGAGVFHVQIVASGATAGDWTDAVGQTIPSTGGTATATVTAVSGTTVDLDVAFATVPTTTPVFTVSATSTGTAPIAPKTDPVAVNDSVVLDTTKQVSTTVDVLANDTASQGYILDPTTLMLVDPITGAQTTTQKGNATLTVNNGKIDVTAIPNWNGYSQATYTATEKWIGPGTEPAGWTPGTVTGTLKVQVIGAAPVQTSTDCTVAAAAMGGKGFAVPAASGGGTNNCNFAAVADSVSIPADATQATVNVGANDIPDAGYKVDPASIQFHAPDGTSFAKDVTYPGQFSLTTDPTTGITTVERIGTFSGTVVISGHDTEYKLDASGNKVVGGSSSALLTINIAPLATPATPTTPADVPTETPTTPAPAPVADSANTPAPAPVADSGSRPFENMGNTASSPVREAARITAQGNGSTDSTDAELAAGLVIALGAAGGAFIVRARHRKAQKSDTGA